MYDNLNPIFYQAVDLVFECNTEDELPPLIFDLYDYDAGALGDGEDYLGRCVVRKEECVFTQSSAIAKPKWHPIRYSTKSPPCGEILASFSIVESDYVFKPIKMQDVDLAAQVEMQEFQVSMNVLGMRALQSPGILPVKKAFVKFNLKGLVPPSVGTDLQNLKTEPKAPGPNPTICTLMRFQVPLPIDPLYCPRLSCQVYDCIFTGWSQPIIGTFIIPIGELIHELQNERDTEIAALRHMVDSLERIAEDEERASLMYQSRREEEEQRLISEGASEEELAKVRDSKENRAKMYKEFADIRRSGRLLADDEQVSVNLDDGDVTGALLQGDSNEELRMADRLAEKAENAKHGKMKRITVEDIRDSQRSPSGPAADGSGPSSAPASAPGLAKHTSAESAGLLFVPNQGSPSGKQRRTSSAKKLDAGPSFQKFDATLKKQLMDNEKERVEKAKRDAEDERQRELEEFRREAKDKGLTTTSNIISPTYYRDETLQVDKEKDKPPESAFLGLGWDEDANTQRRHYRRYYPDELENIKDVLPI